ncbi:MAG: hypothetical protein IJ724_02770 [Muribaculaceae bacterium]|nr:hypothetical protein [Muribaculaceae bacterium]
MDKKERQEATMRFTARYLHDLQQQDALVDKIVERVAHRLEPLIQQMMDREPRSHRRNPHEAKTNN